MFPALIMGPSNLFQHGSLPLETFLSCLFGNPFVRGHDLRRLGNFVLHFSRLLLILYPAVHLPGGIVQRSGAAALPLLSQCWIHE